MRRLRIRRLIAGLLLIWLGVLQFPLPVCAPVEKDLSVAYPCMHRACGCVSASQCWTSCCCTTKQERIAFARKHLGYIPKELAENQELTVTTSKPACSHSCCSKKRPAKPQVASSMVNLRQALECRGIASGWTDFSVAVPVDMHSPEIVIDRSIPNHAVIDVQTIAESPTLRPLTPPPQSPSGFTASV